MTAAGGVQVEIRRLRRLAWPTWPAQRFRCSARGPRIRSLSERAAGALGRLRFGDGHRARPSETWNPSARMALAALSGAEVAACSR
jgi:hypothetical protein